MLICWRYNLKSVKTTLLTPVKGILAHRCFGKRSISTTFCKLRYKAMDENCKWKLSKAMLLCKKKFCFSNFFYTDVSRSFVVFFKKDVLPGSSTFNRETVCETQIKMCMYGEKICMSKTIQVYRSLVIAELCVVLPLILRRPRDGLGGLPSQHSNSSMTSITIVRGPVRIRLLTVR